MLVIVDKTYYLPQNVIDGVILDSTKRSKEFDADQIGYVREYHGSWNADNSKWIPTSVGNAVAIILTREGLTTSDGTGEGFTGDWVHNNYTGEMCTASARLAGFDVETLDEVNRIMGGRK